MGDLSEHFNKSEFKCPCGCGSDNIDTGLVDKLEELRGFLGKPIVITSGVRCPAHNAAVGGVADSAHVSGKAADIRVHSGGELFQMLDFIIFHRIFTRIGIGKTLIHVDVDLSKPTNTVWVYPDK